MEIESAADQKDLPSGETPPAVSQELDGPQARKLLDDLRELWKDLEKKSIQTRHETGKLLNKTLGDPDQRQRYGGQIIDQVCEAIGLVKSEISRLRRFAQQFPTLEALEKQNPAATTWSEVKKLLTKKPKVKAKVASDKLEGTGDSSEQPEPEGQTQAEPAEAEGDVQESSSDTTPQDEVALVLQLLASVEAKLAKMATVSLGADRERIIEAVELVVAKACNLPADQS